MAAEVSKYLHPPHPNYFEGILQVRNVSPDVMEFIYRTIAQDRRAVVVKEKRVGDGWDLYLTSQKYVQSLGKKLQAKYGGGVKVTATLHTRSRTGKDLYRVTVLFRVPRFRAGDTFVFEGEEYEVLRIAKQVQVRHKKSGKRLLLKQEIVERC